MMMPSVRDKRRSRVSEIFCRSFINVAKLLPLNKLRRTASFDRRVDLLIDPVVCTETCCC